MSSNLRIKKENEFRKEIEIFDVARKRFEEKFKEFKSNTELKREWLLERTDSWHKMEENVVFNNYIYDVEEYNSKMEDLLNELTNIGELPINEAI